ncbi:MAG: type II secretion system F family protein [Candidatus Eremiobacteraeota bacterium]|nr:type II secretion system F family protein [Candidatus Eremiobacteraeota bacterium]
MVGALASIFIALFLAVGGGIAVYIVVNAMAEREHPRVKKAASLLELAGINRPVDVVATAIFGIGAFLWFLTTIIMGMGVVAEILTLPFFIAGAFYVASFFINRRVGKRRAKFMDQLEMSLRLMSGGVRIGLSLPQAMTHITEEMTDPARTEFRRVITQTRVGVSTPDALDSLAERMAGNETLMLARVIRVQRQTGGSLSSILDHLAETIKERRQIQRKINALTAEGRIGALVLEALPVGVGFFVIIMERPMGEALLGTLIGHLVLVWAAILELMAIYFLGRMLKVNV